MEDKNTYGTAQKEYYKRTKGRRKTIAANFTTEEADHIQDTLKAHDTSAGEVLREVTKRLDETGSY